MKEETISDKQTGPKFLSKFFSYIITKEKKFASYKHKLCATVLRGETMAEVLGGAFLSAFCDFLLDKISSPQLVDFFLKGRKRKRIEEVVQKLKITMDSFQGVLDDAEEKKMTRSAVKMWLDELKDAFYHADDLLDEIDYEAVRLKIEADSQTTADQVWNILSSLNPFYKDEMEAKLEEILATLDRLAEQKDRLGLRESVGELPWLLSQRTVPTTALLDKCGVYGRDADKKAVMKLVLKESNGVDVIPIVGMGGIGKTTLAQIVYGDLRVKKRFTLKSWVCISVEFDVYGVTKHIIKEFDNSVNCDNMTANQLHDELKNIVQKARFLLVLDDVWPDKDELFDFLLKPLLFGEAGSKIVVTTRNELSWPPTMRRLPTHRLRALKKNASWSLFVKHAFGDENSIVPPELDVMGREIVKKCQGLPLAIKVLGGLLSSKRNAKEWEMILKNNMWNDHYNVERNILPALRLSYYYLPSPLKQCFAFCSIFPRDHRFQKEELIVLWMAEGFIPQSQGIDIKQVGEEYFDDLVSRSFFQLSINSSSNFVMHDVINDLAKSISREFCYRLGADNQVNIGRTRHLSFTKTEHDAVEKLEAIKSAAFLRTLLPIDVHERGQQQNTSCWIDNKVLLDLLPTLSCLRTLSLSGYHNISLVPDSVGHLKHLRYLNLEGALIKNLPDNITILYFLQTLILSKCKNLIKLPVGMARLINLCHLDVTGTKLQEMPPQMGKLTRLQCLTEFFLGNNSGSNIKELGGLKHLRGGLRIWNLQHVENAADALEANFKVKNHLQKLELKWNGATKGSKHDRAVLGQIQPHANLKVLTIDGYGGTRFPNWIGDSSLSNVVTLELHGCKYCSTLPPIGHLASMKDLRIEAFSAVEVIGPEFYGSNTSMKKPFLSLETLCFEWLPKWREWKQLNNSGDEDEKGVFPRLQKLYIKGCPKLTKTLPGYLPSLKELKIEGSPEQLLCSIPRRAPTFDNMILTSFYFRRRGNLAYRLQSSGSFDVNLSKSRASGRLYFRGVHSIGSVMERMGQISYSSTIGKIKIKDCGSLECFQLELFPNLITLCLESCPDLKFISACESLISLTYLEMEKCPNFLSFPEEGLSAPNLKTLKLQRCSNLKSLPNAMHSLLPKLEFLEVTGCKDEKLLKSLNLRQVSSLEKLKIEDCPELQWMPKEGLPSTLKSLLISRLSNLKSLDFLGPQYLTSLENLTIWRCPQIQSMPIEGLPYTLTSLKVGDLANLESLDCKGFQQLSSLKELQISSCRKLQCIPYGGLPSSLSSLSIRWCPILEQRCKRDKGEDWPKISLISKVMINFQTI